MLLARKHRTEMFGETMHPQDIYTALNGIDQELTKKLIMNDGTTVKACPLVI
jgi:hypothetical protein